jgi:hypothetical protein
MIAIHTPHFPNEKFHVKAVIDCGPSMHRCPGAELSYGGNCEVSPASTMEVGSQVQEKSAAPVCNTSLITADHLPIVFSTIICHYDNKRCKWNGFEAKEQPRKNHR